jgi:hypothetical protein
MLVKVCSDGVNYLFIWFTEDRASSQTPIPNEDPECVRWNESGAVLPERLVESAGSYKRCL